MNFLKLIFFCILFAIGITDSFSQETGDSIVQECRNSWRCNLRQEDWPRIITTLGIRTALRIGTVNLLKSEISEWRPDHNDRNSFPSRHSVWAFGIGGKIAYTFGGYNPWWAFGAQTVANAVGFQRVMDERHYPGDVIAGAVIGIGTDLLAFEIANWIFGRKTLFPNWSNSENVNKAQLSISTGASFPLRRKWGEIKLGTALYSNLRGSLPVSEYWSFVADATLSSAPLKQDGGFVQMINIIGLAIGAKCHYWSGPWAVGGVAETGASRCLNSGNIIINNWSLTARCGALGSVMLTRKLAISLEGGYSWSQLEMNRLKHSSPQLYTTFSTQVCF